MRKGLRTLSGGSLDPPGFAFVLGAVAPSCLGETPAFGFGVSFLGKVLSVGPFPVLTVAAGAGVAAGRSAIGAIGAAATAWGSGTAGALGSTKVTGVFRS